MSLTIDRPAVTSDLRFHPVTALIGADVTGVDLRDELDPATVARLREALLKYKVLFFRNQAIDDVQQIRFTRYFGPVTPAHPVTNGLEDLPEIKVNKLFGGIQEYASFRLDADNPLRPLSRARRAGGGISTSRSSPTPPRSPSCAASKSRLTEAIRPGWTWRRCMTGCLRS